MTKTKIKLSTVKDAQTFVNTLSRFEGKFILHYNTTVKDIAVDAKSILGVITIISPTFLTLEHPSDFDLASIAQFL